MTDAITLDDFDAPLDVDAEAPPDFEAPRLKPVDPRTLPARIHNLKAAGVSGAHCLHSFQAGGPESLARRLGTGTHALLFGKRVAVWDQPSDAHVKRAEKAAKEGKPPPPVTKAPRSGDAWKRFLAANTGAVILTGPELAAAERMVAAIRACGPAARLLGAAGLIVEQPIIWSQLGRSRQSTPDMRKPDSATGPSFLAELKTTRCAAPFPFGRDAERLGYHAQLADQAAAIEHDTGKRPRTIYIIAVESSPPHVVQVYEVPPSILETGEALCSQWLERLQMYETTNMWGGYSPRVETLTFPERREALQADPSWMAEGDETPSQGESQ